MSKEQASAIIILLVVVLFVLLVGRAGTIELFGLVAGLTVIFISLVVEYWWVALIGLVVVGFALDAREKFYDWRASSRARKQKKLDDEIERLQQEILSYPGPRLTGDGPPQYFPSKAAAQAFGERWSRGRPDSFSVEHVDVKGGPEQLPGFDKNSISGGITYSYPALFFGMSEASGKSDAWFLDYRHAKKRWLKDYRDHLRKGLAP